MADDIPTHPGPFDVQTIKALVALMSRHDLSEIDLHNGDQRIRLRRGARVVSRPEYPSAISVSAPPSPTAALPTGKTETAPTRPLVEIKSPTPGTFYARQTPEKEPYVKVGSRVTPESVVCLIEAMKTYTDITADTSGVIAEILVQDKQPVEFGTVLFRVDPLG